MPKLKNKPKIQNIKLTLEYEGTDFFGFQRQPQGVATIQGSLEDALTKLFQEKTLILSASGRTDAGVHAEGQVVHFQTSSSILISKLPRAVNHFLPDSISVLKAEVVSQSFHARYHPKSKTYEYRIWNDTSRPVQWRNYALHETVSLDVELMKKASKFLMGRHDFRAFTSKEKISKSRAVPMEKISFIRDVKKISIQRKGKLVTVQVKADGFLYHMVRNLVGTLCAVGKGQLHVRDVKNILQSHDRKKAPATLPALGLTLKKVSY